MLKQGRKWRNEKEAAVILINKALGYLLTSAIYSIRDLIRNQQNALFKLIMSDKSHQHQVKFDFQLEFDHNGSIIPSPSFDDYTTHIMNLYDSVRKVVISEKSVEEFLFNIVSISSTELNKRAGYCISPLDYVKRRSFDKKEKDMLEKAIGSNIKKANDYLYQYRSFSSISDLLKDTESHFKTLKR